MRSALETHIFPTFKGSKFDAIAPPAIEKCMFALRDGGLSAKRVNNAVSCPSVMLLEAKRQGLLPRDPFYVVRPLADNSRERGVLSVEEVTQKSETSPATVFPRLPVDWWIGTPVEWQLFISTFLESRPPLIARGKNGRPLRVGSAPLCAIIMHAAQRKKWMRQTRGTKGTPSACREVFAWSRKVTPQAFKKDRSETDAIGAEPLLRAFGFDDSTIDKLTKPPA